MFEKSRKRARQRAHRTIVKSAAKVEKALRRYQPPSRASARTLKLLTADKPVQGHLAMSNPWVRRIACRASIDAVVDHYARTRHELNLRYFLATFCFDDGLTWEQAPILKVDRMKRKVRRALQRFGLHGIGYLEVDVFSKKLPGEASRRLSLHVHVICWTRDPGFAPEAAAAALRRTRSFRNQLGTAAVEFSSRAKSAARFNGFARKYPERDQTAGSMAWLGQYPLKAPRHAKNRWSDGSRWQICYDARAFRLKTALRMSELWSHLAPADVVFGVGEGSRVADEIRQAIRTQVRASRGKARTIDRALIDDAWRELFEAHTLLRFDRTSIG